MTNPRVKNSARLFRLPETAKVTFLDPPILFLELSFENTKINEMFGT